MSNFANRLSFCPRARVDGVSAAHHVLALRGMPRFHFLLVAHRSFSPRLSSGTGNQACECRAIHVAVGKTAVIVQLRRNLPAFTFLAAELVFAG